MDLTSSLINLIPIVRVASTLWSISNKTSTPRYHKFSILSREKNSCDLMESPVLNLISNPPIKVYLINNHEAGN